MKTNTDSRGNLYVDVANLRITYVRAADREQGADWTAGNSDVIRIQAYHQPSESQSLRSGPEIPIKDDAALGELVVGLCHVCLKGRAGEA
ncbi:MAG: hypothetical protein QM599_08860 [Pseudoxanthomonas sp.]